MIVRAALGAGTRRLRKLLLLENVVLALAGAALGLVVAFAGVGMLARFAARYSPRADEISVDGSVLLFTSCWHSWSQCCSPSRRGSAKSTRSAQDSRPAGTRPAEGRAVGGSSRGWSSRRSRSR